MRLALPDWLADKRALVVGSIRFLARTCDCRAHVEPHFWDDLLRILRGGRCACKRLMKTLDVYVDLVSQWGNSRDQLCD